MLWLLVTALAMQAQEEVRVSSHNYVPALKVDTKLVEIVAVVRDGHGKAVGGLTKDDFRVLDDGKERAIDHFVIEQGSQEAANDHRSPSTAEGLKTGGSPAGPRFLALFIDDVNAKDGASGGDLKRTQEGAVKFVKDALKAGVRIGVFTVSGEPKLDFTSDPAKLIEAVMAIKPHIRMHEEGLRQCPRITPYLAYRIAYERDRSAMGAALYASGQNNCPATQQSILLQAEDTWRQVKLISADTLSSLGHVVDYLGTMPGKREMIMASSGFVAVSMQEQKDQVIDKALHAGVVISALDSKGLFGEAPAGLRPEDPIGYCCGPGAQAAAGRYQTHETVETPLRLDTVNEPMENLADGTGGVFYHNNNDLNAGFHKLGEPPPVLYRLSFRPDGVAADGSYHKLKVTAKGHAAQARPGYFAPKERAEEQSLQSKIDREILADDAEAGFPVTVAIEPGEAAVTVIVSVDISKLRFTKQGDRQVQRIAFVSALIDSEGRIAAAKEGVMDLALTEETYNRLKASGVNAKISLLAPKGSYKLRQVSEDAVEGKIACSTHVIDIR